MMPHGIYPKDLADRLIAKAGQPFQPSNGTEGEIFIVSWCGECEHDVNMDCPIIAASMAYQPGDVGYPKEWIYGEDGQPKCTAHSSACNPRCNTLERSEDQIDMF